MCPKRFPSLWYVWRKPCIYLALRLTLSPNGPKQASTWHTLPRSTIGCAQSDFHACRLFCHKPCTYLAPRLKLSPNGSKWASTWSTSPRSTVRCVQNDLWAYGTFGKTIYLSCVEINTISKWTETSFHLTHVTLEYHRLHPKWFPKQWYVWCKPCTYLAWDKHYLQMERNKLPYDIHYLEIPGGVPKAIFMLVVDSSQTMHLSCANINTISKHTKTSFPLTHVT
jgi:hypothetical protein